MATAQTAPLSPVAELINRTDSSWPLVQAWLSTAKNSVEVLPVADRTQAEQALYQTQVTTRSPMGAIVYETGGLLIDSGWIRILGSGHPRLARSLPGWNLGKSMAQIGDRAPFLLIADDAVGGFFALNGGALGADMGKVYYFAPERLAWEPLHLTYSDFINFCFTGDLNKFYDGLRWTGWQREIAQLDGNQAMAFYPFLWAEYPSLQQLIRKPVPVSELWTLEQDAVRQLNKPSR
ncbi:DUF2625 domain-containing protein [Hymenobacter sp. B81]|uniref:DUF2625 domain-containing protein n=1 Tax=Hymenobacter sp. B81 TaxID=3344878 RepID=UPI0037DD62A4